MAIPASGLWLAQEDRAHSLQWLMTKQIVTVINCTSTNHAVRDYYPSFIQQVMLTGLEDDRTGGVS
jgi:hypothetical protein